MSLLNYTTEINPERSISEISKTLAKVGARRIPHDYDQNGYIVALSFQIKLPSPNVAGVETDIAFRLPTDWRPILKVLEQDRKVPRRLKTQEQALRVAWRITKDWVEAQAAYIETMTVTTAQVFLPYAITREGKTLYEYIADNPHLLIGGE